MEMLLNCLNDIYNYVVFLYVSLRVNFIRVFVRKVFKKFFELFKFGNENYFIEIFGNFGSKIK